MNLFNKAFTIAVLFIFFGIPSTAQTYAERLGFSKQAKVIILHVDDAGMSFDSNEGAIRAMEEGVANSLSMMMPCSWIPGMFQYLKQKPNTDAGLHLTLTSEWSQYRWGPLAGKSAVPGLVDKQGAMWKSVLEVAGHASPDEVYKEIKAQIDRSRTAGWEPTHLDSHMGTLFATENFLKKYIQAGIEEKIPVMFPGGHNTMIMKSEGGAILKKDQTDQIGKMLWDAGLPVLDDLHNVTYGFKYPKGVSDSELQKIAVQQYINSFKQLQPGVTMVIMHCTSPSEIFSKISDSGNLRKADLLAMISPELKAYIQQENIILTTWRELKSRRDKIN
ncbi:MAG: hypothetical protein RLZZ595_921 [Bacteroidota bacterium]|jgi:predicted glycoside hydrolase/deacetylase ChbG (UPF0249 family)